MVDNNAVLKVYNRDSCSVVYKIPDMNNLRREFQVGETKDITMEEMKKLSYVPGGIYLIKNSLVIKNNPEAIIELLGEEPEPEYYYTKDDIKNLLLNGSAEQLMDCLDFAPQGVIDMVKDAAVALKINDLQKRKIIFDKTGYNVNNAITLVEQEQNEEEEEAPVKQSAKRRAAPIKVESNNTESTPTRKAAPPKYNVVSK